MSKEKELNEVIEKLMAEYHTNIDSYNRVQEKAKSDEIKSAKADLSTYLAKGAKSCACEGKPFGMLKRPAILKDGIVDKAAIYAVYCNKCEKHSFGNTPKEAVQNWNKGNHLGKGA